MLNIDQNVRIKSRVSLEDTRSVLLQQEVVGPIVLFPVMINIAGDEICNKTAASPQIMNCGLDRLNTGLTFAGCSDWQCSHQQFRILLQSAAVCLATVRSLRNVNLRLDTSLS